MAKILGEDKTKDTTKKEEDRIYQLIEMTDSMKQSVDNLKKVIDEQSLLESIISKDENAKKLEAFLKSIAEQKEELRKQAFKLDNRINMFEDIIDLCQKNDSANKLINLFIRAIGMFE